MAVYLRKGEIPMKAWKHFCTITKHKWLVLCGCFRVGARYYQGVRSPNGAEREEKGYSEAWIHHKGRNPHHYEYWTDMHPVRKVYEPVPMPRKYFVEMIMDRRAACMTYQGKNYRDDSALVYFNRSIEKDLMHPETRRQLLHVLTMLAEKGEKETFRYLREEILTGKPWPWEAENRE